MMRNHNLTLAVPHLMTGLIVDTTLIFLFFFKDCVHGLCV